MILKVVLLSLCTTEIKIYVLLVRIGIEILFFSSKCNFKSLNTRKPAISIRKVINFRLSVGLSLEKCCLGQLIE